MANSNLNKKCEGSFRTKREDAMSLGCFVVMVKAQAPYKYL